MGLPVLGRTPLTPSQEGLHLQLDLLQITSTEAIDLSYWLSLRQVLRTETGYVCHDYCTGPCSSDVNHAKP